MLALSRGMASSCQVWYNPVRRNLHAIGVQKFSGLRKRTLALSSGGASSRQVCYKPVRTKLPVITVRRSSLKEPTRCASSRHIVTQQSLRSRLSHVCFLLPQAEAPLPDITSDCSGTHTTTSTLTCLTTTSPAFTLQGTPAGVQEQSHCVHSLPLLQCDLLRER